MATDVAPIAPTAADLRRRLADELTAEGATTTEAVTRAILSVPQEVFAPPGTDLAEAYTPHGVITKRGADGQAMSSVSALWLQARMIEQAGVRTGQRVLETGSGGYNAALLAEVVGPTESPGRFGGGWPRHGGKTAEPALTALPGALRLPQPRVWPRRIARVL